MVSSHWLPFNDKNDRKCTTPMIMYIYDSSLMAPELLRAKSRSIIQCGNTYELQLLQNAAAKTVFGLYKHDHMGDILYKLHWLPLKYRIFYKMVLIVFKCLNGMGPIYLSELLSYSSCSHTLVLNEPLVRSSYGSRAFYRAGPHLWNSLPSHIRECKTLTSFKSKLKTHLFMAAFQQL